MQKKIDKKTKAPSSNKEEQNRITKKQKIEQSKVAEALEMRELDKTLTCIEKKFVASLYVESNKPFKNAKEQILSLVSSLLPANKIWSLDLFYTLGKTRDAQSLIDCFLCNKNIQKIASQETNNILQRFFSPKVLEEFNILLSNQSYAINQSIAVLKQNNQDCSELKKFSTRMEDWSKKNTQKPFEKHQELQEIDKAVKQYQSDQIWALKQKLAWYKGISTNPITFFNQPQTQIVETPYVMDQRLPDNQNWLVEQQSQINTINNTQFENFFNQTTVNSQDPEQDIIWIESDDSDIYSYDLS